MVRDLTEIAVNMVRQKKQQKLKTECDWQRNDCRYSRPFYRRHKTTEAQEQQ